MDEHRTAQVEHEKAILDKLVVGGFESLYDDDDEETMEDVSDIHVTGFIVLPIIQITDTDGDTHEMVTIWSTSKSALVKYGVLEMARQTLDKQGS